MFKGALKRFTSLFLVTIMALAMIPAASIPVFAASVTTGVTGLAADYSGGSWSGGNGNINGSISPSESSGCTGTSYSQATSTLTLKNTSGNQAVLSFDYAPSNANGGSASVAGSTVTASGSYSGTVDANGTVVIEIKSGSAQGAKTSLSLTNIALSTVKNVTTTFLVPEHGSYTVDGIPVSSQTTKTQSNSDIYLLSATPASGYKLFGWSWRALAGGTDIYFSKTASTDRSFNEDGFVVPVFVLNTTPIWGVGNNLYTDLNNAIADKSSNTVFLASDGTLPSGNYEIPNGKTVLIPFDSANTIYKNEPEVIYNSYSTPTKFRELTMLNEAQITIKSGGALCVNGKLSSKGQMGGYNGTPTGPDGRINMQSGSNITLESGANLYCWGYIYGSGSVEAKSGSTVYEAFQIKDWRGGTATSNVYDYAFIFNQYYIQNIEVPLTLYAGATEKLYSSVNASSSSYPMGATFVGSGGMFNITSGYMVKDYVESTDRLQIDFYGDASITPMTLTGLPLIGSVSTNKYILPITSNITVNIHSGITSIAQDIELLPSVEINIDSGATLNVNSGKKVYVYDNANWGNFTGSASFLLAPL